MEGKMANWKNVNNWHWTEKNCTPWAVDYLTKALVDFNTSNDLICLKIKDVKSIDGEVDLNQRKGKILYFYDLKITANWKAETLEKSVKSSGTVIIPEFSHEINRPADLSFSVTVNDESNKDVIFRENISKILREPIYDLLLRFRKDLVDDHAPSIKILDDKMTSQTCDLKNAPAKSASAPILGSTGGSTIASSTTTSSDYFRTVNLHQTVRFSATPSDIYNLLTDIEQMRIWSRGQVTYLADEKSFRLFGGNIHFSFTEQLANKKLVMKWRLSKWPESLKDSIVQIELSSENNETLLRLEQIGVPASDVDQLQINWDEYYWKPMKRIFGYGSDF